MEYDLNDLRCLAVVLREGSMSAAAPKLSVSIAAVSRRIARLETELGTDLVTRSVSGITPTSVAQDIVAQTTSLLAEVDAAVASALHQNDAISGPLCITAPRAASEHFLGRWLFDFALEHPGLTLDCIASDQWLSIDEARVDVAVRVGPLPDSDLHAVRLCAVPYVLTGAPLHQKAALKSLKDEGWQALRHLDCVVALPYQRWGCIERGVQTDVYPQVRVQVNSLSLAADAVAQGLGLGYLPLDIARSRHLEAIELGAFDIKPLARPMFAVAHRASLRLPRIRALVEMLRTKMSEHAQALGLLA